MTKEDFYKLTDILDSEVLGNFMHGGEAAEVIAMFEEKAEKSGLIKNEEPVSEDLYEAATKYAEKKCFLDKAILTDGEMLIAKAKQRFDFYNLATAFEDGANWQKERVLKAMDLGEPPYLISVEQAYYNVKKLLEE